MPVDCKLATASCLFPKLGQNSGWKFDLESGRILIGPAKQGTSPVSLAVLNTKVLLESIANHCLLPDRDIQTSV